MNETNKRSAMEDLRVIRGVLDQTTSSLRGLAPCSGGWAWCGWCVC